MGLLRRLVAPLGVLAIVLGLGACGEDDFENEQRAAKVLEITAAIDDENVTVSPGEIGAGIANLTVSNQTADPVRLTLEGPTSHATGEIVPGATGTIKADLQEGSYEAAAGAEIDIKPDTLEVGPARPSAQNDLLLP